MYLFLFFFSCECSTCLSSIHYFGQFRKNAWGNWRLESHAIKIWDLLYARYRLLAIRWSIINNSVHQSFQKQIGCTCLYYPIKCAVKSRCAQICFREKEKTGSFLPYWCQNKHKNLAVVNICLLGFYFLRIIFIAFLRNCLSKPLSFCCVKLNTAFARRWKEQWMPGNISGFAVFGLTVCGADFIQRSSKAELTFAWMKTAVTFLAMFVLLQSYPWLTQPLIHATAANTSHIGWHTGKAFIS